MTVPDFAALAATLSASHRRGLSSPIVRKDDLRTLRAAALASEDGSLTPLGHALGAQLFGGDAERVWRMRLAMGGLHTLLSGVMAEVRAFTRVCDESALVLETGGWIVGDVRWSCQIGTPEYVRLHVEFQYGGTCVSALLRDRHGGLVHASPVTKTLAEALGALRDVLPLP